jgi:phage-related protein
VEAAVVDETIEIEVHAEVGKLAVEVQREIKKIAKTSFLAIKLVLDRSGLAAEYKRIQKEMKAWEFTLPAPKTAPQSRAPKTGPPVDAAEKERIAAERSAAKLAREAEKERKAAERLLKSQESALKKEIAEKEKALRVEERAQAKLLREREQARKAEERTARQNERNNTRTNLSVATLGASAEMAAWKARQKKLELEVEVKKDSLKKVGIALAALSGGRATGDIVSNLGKKLGNLDRNVPKIAATATAVGTVGVFALSSLSSVFALGAALTSLAGIAGLIPAAIGAAGASTGTLLTVFNGVGKALGAIQDAKTPKVTEDPAIAAAAREKSVQAIADAEANAADAIVQAHKKELKAADEVVSAKKKLGKASSDVAKAYEEERKAVKALDSDLQHAKLNALDAEDAMNNAKDALAQASSNPASFSPDAMKELRKEVTRTTLEFDTQSGTVADLKAEQAKATKLGIDGSDRVVAAIEAEAEARKSLQEAEQAVTDTAAESIKSQLEGQRAISDAKKSLAIEDLRRTAEQNAASDAANLALSSLTPMAAAAAVSISKIRDRLGEVRDIAQESFFTGFTGPLERLADTILPQLKAGMGGLASSMGSGVQQFMDSLNKNLGGGVLERMFGNTTAANDLLNGSIEPLVRAFVKIGDVGSSFLPQLAEGFTQISTQFGAFIDKVSADGSLATWIQGGLDTAKQLGTILGGVGNILGGIAKAASDAGSGNILGSLGDSLGRIGDIVNSEPFHSTLVTIFKAAGEAIGNMSQAIGPIGDMFTSLAPTLAVVLPMLGTIVSTLLGGIAKLLSDPAFASGLTTMFTGVLSAVQSLQPAMEPLGQILGVVMGVVGELAKVLGPILAELFVALAPLITTLATALMPLIQALGPLLGAAITAVMPFLNLIIGVISSLVPIVTAVVEIVTGLISGDFTKVFEGVGHFFDAQGKFYEDFFTKLIPGFLETMVGKVDESVKSFLKFFGDIPEGIKGIFNDLFKWVFDSGGKIVTGLMNGIKKAIPALAPVVDGMMNVIGARLPHSPPPKGPLSGKNWAEPAGKTIPLALADGMLSKKDALARASESVMGAVVFPVAPKAGTTAAIQRGVDARTATSGTVPVGTTVINETNNWNELGSPRNTLIQKNRLDKRGA